MNYLLFNPLAKNRHAEEDVKVALPELVSRFGEFSVSSVIGLDANEFLQKLTKDDLVILFGGDGTLNHFANDVYGKELPCPFYLYKAGTGNDFLNDVADEVKDNLIELSRYVENLPVVIINDKETRFLNGVGFGLDGTVCEIADQQIAAGKEKIDYTAISIKLLLGGFKCPSAKVTVDGVTKEYKKVWLASGMNGRYYGGGMNVAPNQDRLGDTLTSVVFHDSGKLRTLMVFPKIFKGEHIKHSKMVDVRVGKDITVEFSRPNALQIDGETVLNVTKYRIIKK